MARVIVVGGGYGGITVAKGLDAIADVILVEQKDQFVHHAAALRAAVDDVWGSTIFMPYSYLLERGQVIQGTVSRIDGTTVHIYGQEPIEGDYVVIATGSSYPFPAKHVSRHNSVAKSRLEQLHRNLQAASSVLLVGGGTVGLEFAGELASAFPDLQITVVEKESEILPSPGYTPELRQMVADQVEEMGISVRLGSRLAYLPHTPSGELGRFRVETEDGDSIEADIWFQCYGSQPATGLLQGTDYTNVLNQDGTLRVDEHLQVVGHPHVYAVGDMTDAEEAKRADAARRQARVVIANIANQIDGGDPDVSYQPTKAWVVIPLGPNRGGSQLLDQDGNTRLVGAEQTAEIKGTDLMLSVIRSQLNLP